ncbi:2-C-methyl-D-erythritol 4-phosphate cytidylyltransferase [Marmoricola endophyticus]|uniref:2-C-methyl-D-erythritol 4-phosphate cytidylyltransferase n=1 Tax=Marmoricola endophyticus TaxID=2040280 RepID=A0A917F6A0_9ACTN|nr:2-C-methyl-D-erythritol 4-phosphate cytidylyltransferase [Marmoricola endophyticus]GGF52026.1 2-C-methyl-D-erythritol 4-phosphate cytidylyltransferase [Marmoricola endophyticus]
MTSAARGGTRRAAAVLLAGGSGRRTGSGTNKALLPLGGWPALAWSVRTVLDLASVHRLVVVCRAEERADVAEALGPHLGDQDVWLVDGGAERQHSEKAALDVLRADVGTGEVELVAIHDTARPLATPALWEHVLAAAAEHGGALPALDLPGLVPADGTTTLPALVGVQTPQAFLARELLQAYDAAAAGGFVGTDTASVVASYSGLTVVTVPGEPTNLKVTWPEDLAVADRLLSDRVRR